jgi:hypothetical protein
VRAMNDKLTSRTLLIGFWKVPSRRPAGDGSEWLCGFHSSWYFSGTTSRPFPPFSSCCLRRRAAGPLIGMLPA